MEDMAHEKTRPSGMNRPAGSNEPESNFDIKFIYNLAMHYQPPYFKGQHGVPVLVSGGISPSDAIRIGTLNSAIFLGKQRDRGSIEEGKVADLVLLDADPLADINNAKRINLVMKNGEIIDLA